MEALSGKRTFDIKQGYQVAESFANATGLACTIIDDNGRPGAIFGQKVNVYEMLNIPMDILYDSFLYGAHQSVNFGGSYIFFGPSGLVYFTSPIVESQALKAAFVIGPFLMTEPDRFLCESLLEHSSMTVEDDINVIDVLNRVPLRTTTEVKGLADLLYYSIFHLTVEAYEMFEEAKRHMDLGAEIAGYLTHLKTMGGDTFTEAAYPLEKEKELMNRISIGDEKGATKILNEIMAFMYLKYGDDFTALKSRVLELVVLLSRASLEGGAQAEEIFGLNYIYLQSIHKFDSVNELTDWLALIIQRFSNAVFGFGEAKHKDAIYRTIQYIRQEYMNKITLEEAAKRIHFSGPYLSKIFKRETGTTFVKYLNRVRIANSEAMLRDKDLSLAEISDAVGFHDQSHFSRNFKAIHGISPLKFRESLK